MPKGLNVGVQVLLKVQKLEPPPDILTLNATTFKPFGIQGCHYIFKLPGK